jgi:hypothetical protein
VRIATAQIAGPLDLDAIAAACFLAPIAAARGDDEALERCRCLAAQQRDATYLDLRASALAILARDAIERGDSTDALRLVRAVLDFQLTGSETICEAHALGIEAAIALDDETALAELERFVAGLPPARAVPLLRAGRARLLAELAHRHGDRAAATRFEDEAVQLLSSLGARPLLAKALLERARRRVDQEASDEARAIYQELGATRWLERLDAIAAEVPA